VLWRVLAEGLSYAAAGLALGVGASLVLMRGLQALLFEITPTDPTTLGVVSMVLAGVSFAACLAPARRAMRVDPVEALRSS
jgi:ABC-type antimicrobial peptide transport system permease subunit